MRPSTPERCPWAECNDEMRAYHDREWGVPAHDDHHLFEMLVLGGAQAGLSWRSILQRRDGYRRAFHDFDIGKLARMTDATIERHLANPGLIRNRAKIASVRTNARAALQAIDAFGSLDTWLWSFVDGKPKVNRWRRNGDVPAETRESKAMSEALRVRGFVFAGPTVCYAFMQAAGMVDDHLLGCFRHTSRRTS